MLNTASTNLARVLVGLVWRVDSIIHPTIKIEA
jgi:hypothetical protein